MRARRDLAAILALVLGVLLVASGCADDSSSGGEGGKVDVADSEFTDETGTDIAFSHILSADDLPAIARAVVPGRFVITREQHFEPFHEATNEARGRYGAQIPAPVDLTGDYVLADTEQGSRMRMETVCRARVPIIGGQIEQLLMNGLKTLFSREGEFTTDWVARHL